MTPPPKVLQVCAVDMSARFLLRPLIDRLDAEGLEVHIACSGGPHLRFLEDQGVKTREIEIARSILTSKHLRSLRALIRLIRRERYDIVHVHTPIAAVLGRVAARRARVPRIIYTAHGFYFHDLMAPWKRRLIIWIERLLGRCCTDILFTQSEEDRGTAIRERIVSPERATWIGNGVDPARFRSAPDPSLCEKLGLSQDHLVLGFVGRLVREKGVRELLEALRKIVPEHPTVRLLVVGDTLSSDRSRNYATGVASEVASYGLSERVVFTGFQDDPAPYYALMDVFVLPSHREGMPRTILEAMASGLPVVATDIRGCREEVLDGVTGRLVPVRDAAALAEAIGSILSDPAAARAMGEKGRSRLESVFLESDVLDRQLRVYKEIVQSISCVTSPAGEADSL